MKRLLALIASAPLLVGAAHAQLFTFDSPFTVQGTNSPGTFSDAATLANGTQSFTTAQGTLTLQVFTATGTGEPGAEWLVFDYNTENGVALSQSAADWALNEVGLQATEALNIDEAFVQFLAGSAGAQPFTFILFGGFTLASAPPSDLTAILSGPGLDSGLNPHPIGGPGPLGPLGSSLLPFGQLDTYGVTSANVTGYVEALEFSPQSVTPSIPEASTWVMMLTGFGLLGFAGMRKDKRKVLAA